MSDTTEDQPGTGPMTGALYIRMPSGMAEEVRIRAAAAGQGGAEWVRDRIARTLRQPRPRAHRQGRAPTLADVKLLVSVQELVATVGLSLQRAAEIEARSPRPDAPRAGYADTVPPGVAVLRTASVVLVDLIGARCPP